MNNRKVSMKRKGVSYDHMNKRSIPWLLQLTKILVPSLCMRILLASFLLLCCFKTFAQQQSKAKKSDTLYWSPSYQLRAEDYEGVPELASGFDAISIFPIVCDYYMDSTTNSLKFNIYSFFEHSSSWINPEKREDRDLLQHEQLHFDIVELYTRIIKQRIREYQAQGRKKEEDYVDLINTLLNEEGETQIRYDTETDLSRNDAKQKLWTQKVKVLLTKKQIRQFK